MTNICEWAKKNEILEKYHKEDWGKISCTESDIVEAFILETLQCGLSWDTILKKREEYRKAFFKFNLDLIYKEYLKDNIDTNKLYEYLINKHNIIQNKSKTRAILTNCEILFRIKKEKSIFDFFWRFSNHTQIINKISISKNKPISSEISINMSKELKKMGFKYIGPKVCYSFMESIGMINNHIVTCKFREQKYIPYHITTRNNYKT